MTPLPKVVQNAIAGTDPDWTWMWASKEEKEEIDKWVVENKHPSAYEPGTILNRFHRLVREASAGML